MEINDDLEKTDINLQKLFSKLNRDIKKDNLNYEN
jgi:hypothetical protein